MSCARIRNKPLKFLDPQQKLILDLKDEIKRLRNENIKLRRTISTTAPSTADNNQNNNNIDNNSMNNDNIISELNEEIIDIENKQIESVHNLINTTKNKNLVNNITGGRIYAKVYKNQKIAPKDGKISKIDLYGHEVMQLLASSSTGNSFSSNSSMNYSYDSYNSNIDNLSDNGSNSENNDHHSISSTKSRSSKSSRRNKAFLINHDPNSEEIHDLVRRGATGPLIFRNRKAGQSSVTTIAPIKETSYFVIPPAQSRLKSMEGKIKEELYKMLVIEQKSSNLVTSGDIDINDIGYDESNNSIEVSNGSRKSSGNESVQIMPLSSNHRQQLDNNNNSNNNNDKRNTGKKTKKKLKTKEKEKELKQRSFYLKEPIEPPVWKAQKKVSPYVAHLFKKSSSTNSNSGGGGGGGGGNNVNGSNRVSHANGAKRNKNISKHKGVILPPIVLATNTTTANIDADAIAFNNDDGEEQEYKTVLNYNENITNYKNSKSKSIGIADETVDLLPPIGKMLNTDAMKKKIVEDNQSILLLPPIISSATTILPDSSSDMRVKPKKIKNIHPPTTITSTTTDSIASTAIVSKQKPTKLVPILPKISQLNTCTTTTINSNNNMYGINIDKTSGASSSGSYKAMLISSRKEDDSTTRSSTGDDGLSDYSYIHRYDDDDDDDDSSNHGNHYAHIDPDLVEHLVINDIVSCGDGKDNIREKLMKVELSLAQEREVCIGSSCYLKHHHLYYNFNDHHH